MILRSLSIVALAAMATASAAPDPEIEERVDVSRVLLDVRAVDGKGRPIPGLEPSDFLVKIDGREAKVDSTDWIGAAMPDLSDLPEEAGVSAPGWDGSHRGRLIILYFQRDLDRSRLKGLMRMRDEVHRFVRGLREEDRVALLVHDTHLRLYSDFTTDREALGDLLSEAVVYQNPAPVLEGGPGPSLARIIDRDTAAEATHAEDGLLLVARALEHVPGAKTLIYVGWGLNRWDGATKTLGTALGLLIHGRVTMYALDVTDADYHTLEAPIVVSALETGGFYQKTNVFAELAMTRVEHAMTGRYELAFVPPKLEAGRHSIDITLRGRKGTTYHKRFYDD